MFHSINSFLPSVSDVASKQNGTTNTTLMKIQKTVLERFNEKYIIDQKTNCWNWTAGCRTKSNYGSMSVTGKMIDAHRISYTLFNGPIENNLWVLHKCDNKKCVNPEHLFLGNNQDNVQDYIKKFGTIRRDQKVIQSHRIVHGYKRYNKGCRCDVCKKAKSNYYYAKKNRQNLK